MAMFSPFSALTAAAGGFAKNFADDQTKAFDMMGMQALGNAFKQMQGPISPLPGVGGIGPQGGQPGPQAPPPGQSSQPMQPPAMGPAAAAPPPGGAMPPGVPASPPGGSPPPPMSGPPPGGGGMIPGGGQIMGGGPGGPPMGGGGQPQGGGTFDLQTLAAKIAQANPNLPPQALVSALTRAVPLLNAQGKNDLALLRLEMQKQGLDIRRDTLEARERSDDRRIGLGERREQRLEEKDKQQAASGLSPEAIDDGAQKYLKTGQLPSLGWGAQARQDKAAILNAATQKRQALGMPVDKMIKDQQKLKAEQVAIQRFESGPQGNTTRSLGVVVDHLATLRELGTALQNNDLPLFNRVAQAWAEQTGSAAPTNFDTAKRIVGAEIIKALGVAGAGTADERKEAADAFSRARSPEQIDGAIKTAQKLLVGQVNGLRRQFIQSTGLPGEAFDNMLGPEAQNFLKIQGGKSTEPQAAPDPMDAAKDKLREGMAPKGQTKSGWSFEAMPAPVQ